MSSLIKNIQNFAFQYKLWNNGSRVVLGVSGGPDSVFLLYLFAELAKKYDFKLHIAHVNYNLRGKDSSKDEIFVKDLATRLNIPFSIFKPKKSLYKGNLENCLREIRYSFFEETRKRHNFDLIAVAHTMDDQAETVLMRIIRGSGLNGLTAMKPKNGRIIRPLLQVSREDILAVLSKKEIKYRIDKTNFEKKFMRNRIRQELLPYLESSLNPSIKKTISQWSNLVADDYEFIDKNAERFVKEACKNKYATFSADAFQKLHPSIQRQALRLIAEGIKNGLHDFENEHIEEMRKLLESRKNKSQKAQIRGLNVLKKGDKVVIKP